MVAGLREPNVVQAVMAHLAADADIAALVGNRIANQFPEGSRRWPMPTYAILVRRAGGMAPEMDIGAHRPRLDVRCFGAGATPAIRRRTADDLWQIVNMVLSPPPLSGVPCGWRTATLIISSADAEMEPIPDTEPSTDWQLVLCSYRIKYLRRTGG